MANFCHFKTMIYGEDGEGNFFLPFSSEGFDLTFLPFHFKITEDLFLAGEYFSENGQFYTSP